MIITPEMVEGLDKSITTEIVDAAMSINSAFGTYLLLDDGRYYKIKSPYMYTKEFGLINRKEVKIIERHLEKIS